MRTYLKIVFGLIGLISFLIFLGCAFYMILNSIAIGRNSITFCMIMNFLISIIITIVNLQIKRIKLSNMGKNEDIK